MSPQHPIIDLLTLIFGILMIVSSLAALLFPRWFDWVLTPYQSPKARKQLKQFGLLFLAGGIVLLLLLVVH
jgi:hypothetical protein